MIKARTFISPITRKRLARFRKMRLAWWSLWILIGLYVLSLGSELLCNDKPLYVRYEGKSHFPVFFYYPEKTFVPGGLKTRPDYKKIAELPSFKDDSSNFMIFPPIPFGPYKSADPKSIMTSDHVMVSIAQTPRVGAVDVNPKLEIIRSNQAGNFFGKEDRSLRGASLPKLISLPNDAAQAVKSRFRGEDSPRFQARVKDAKGNGVEISIPAFTAKTAPPRLVRLTFRDDLGSAALTKNLSFVKSLEIDDGDRHFWDSLPQELQKRITDKVEGMFAGYAEPFFFKHQGMRLRAGFAKDEVRFPYPPVKSHLMGIDGAGRDVLARILYGLRTSLSFGLILVVVSMGLGTAAGAIQGYYGGLVDITGQRITEIWSAIPFLYVMILLGSVYGRSFLLLLVCYAIFNWIGISYYMRAEFLRLRRQAFVESASCMGVPDYKIMIRHILPNGLVPIITFFPFFLVGAIGSLAALDYLGFGLPPPTPSWGELLAQAQTYRWAWWLILYPSAALFIVMLLGVFIGEGVRNAFDPKQFSRLR
ncbi:binding-protein-dependent transport systems inner membrane component [Desulfatibacillum aliphaticivorans]|uniref:Binding-protein-dependent transport systems inner membrane component n=1 Tax=Desulfatibacillum aliphaticivorans TaxID=218208 RepID=B8FIA0_DESAL|nr:ABC transporter permease subunit [Desulfatibacillum aliphaticivorans]ACL02667.1 binding-protein-dependent transport systems inner membrane component [Desulfatibacillum aliphaticivorans]